MSQSVTLPLWLFVLIVAFAAITFASHFLFPSVRWFFRRRAERVIARLNQRLARPIEPFKLARRYDMIQRLIYDPEVTEAIVKEARADGIPENVAFERARRYAREIVPSFSATAYFAVGARLARWLSRSFYRIRLGAFDRATLEKIGPESAVVFVMNHRSNMDYVLVTYLVSRAGALSYAVGEWARIWPLSTVIRAMGAYFIRRKSRGQLYRRVLARYVQMATQGGVAQAMFPEGGLSLTGAMAEPKLGLLSYIVTDWDPSRRDVIFVPVGLNYDRVLEDRILIAAGQSGERKFKAPLGQIARSTLAHIWQRVTFRFKPLGTASVSFGDPLRLSDFMVRPSGDMTEALAAELAQRIERAIPVLPVPLVCHLLRAGDSDLQTLTKDAEALLARLRQAGVSTPRRDAGTCVNDALDILRVRNLVQVTNGRITVDPAARDILAYYAASIAHHLGPGAADVLGTAESVIAPPSSNDAAMRQT